MADISSLSPGQVLSFELVTNLLASEYRNVVLEAVVTYKQARKIEDVDATHANIIGSLPEGTPKSAREYNYLHITMPNGEERAVGIPWIKDPINVISTQIVDVRIRGKALDDADIVAKALRAYGFDDYEIKVNGHAWSN